METAQVHCQARKTFTWMVNQAKLRSFNTDPRYKYGFEVSRTVDQANAFRSEEQEQPLEEYCCWGLSLSRSLN